MGKTKTNITDTKFYTNGKITICNLTCRVSRPNNPVFHYVNVTQKLKALGVNYRGEFKVRAKAYCHDNDQFNEELGKAIAKSRAKVKMYEKATKIWECYENGFKKLSIECSDRSRACLEVKDLELEHLEEICNF